jgi:hypothetical protein
MYQIKSAPSEISIATYVRLKPIEDDLAASRYNVERSSFMGRSDGWVDYDIERVGVLTNFGNAYRDILHIKVPRDVNPGLVNNNSTGLLKYEFDQVFDTDTTQERIFDSVARSRIEDALKGINCTIFAYGQTGSGKTYTTSGGGTFNERGLIPRTIGFLFETISTNAAANAAATANANTNASPNMTLPTGKSPGKAIANRLINQRSLRCQISFTEIYNEVVYDLLDEAQREIPLKSRRPVQILENSDGGLILRNVNVYEVTTEGEALGLFFMGCSSRISDSTSMNSESSRSHAIFTIIVETTEKTQMPQALASSPKSQLLTPTKGGNSGSGFNRAPLGVSTTTVSVCVGKIHLVDLAGSERMYKMTNTDEQRKEAKSINLSLHYLENVILALRNKALEGMDTSNGNGIHVPYRNSVLTNMLRDSLGGNCRSCFILNLSIDKLHFEESISTCRFGIRCGEIKLKINANMQIPLDIQLKDANKTILELKKKNLILEKNYNEVTQNLELYKTNGDGDITDNEIALCKGAIHSLLNEAKYIVDIMQTNLSLSGTSPTSSPLSSPSSTTSAMSNKDKDKVTVTATLTDIDIEENNKKCNEIRESSLNDFNNIVNNMRRCQLIELSISMSKLLQTYYIDKDIYVMKEIMKNKNNEIEKKMKLKSKSKFDDGGAISAAEYENTISRLKDENARLESMLESRMNTNTNMNMNMNIGKNNRGNDDNGSIDSGGMSSPSTPRTRLDSGSSINMSNIDPVYRKVREVVDTLKKGSNFLKTSKAMGIKSLRFLQISSDCSFLSWRKVDNSNKNIGSNSSNSTETDTGAGAVAGTQPSVVAFEDILSFNIVGRQSNTILMTIKGNQTIKFKYVNGKTVGENAIMANYWCHGLVSLLRQTHDDHHHDEAPDGLSPPRRGSRRLSETRAGSSNSSHNNNSGKYAASSMASPKSDIDYL